MTYIDSLDAANTFNIYRVPVDVNMQIEVSLHLYVGSPTLRMGFAGSLKDSDYELGPYDVKQYAQNLHLEETPGFFEAIVPPKSEFSKIKAYFIEDDFYIMV